MTETTPGKNRSAAQRESEAALGRLEQQSGPFAAAVEATRMPMVITDPSLADNPIVFANAAFLQMCGYDRDEVLGQNYHFLSGPDTDPEVARKIDAALGARQDFTLEVQFYRKGGGPFWTMQFVSPVIDQDGRITQHFASQIGGKASVEGGQGTLVAATFPVSSLLPGH